MMKEVKDATNLLQSRRNLRLDVGLLLENEAREQSDNLLRFEVGEDVLEDKLCEN